MNAEFLVLCLFVPYYMEQVSLKNYIIKITLNADTGNISMEVFFITYAVLKHVGLNILIITLNKDLRKTFKELMHSVMK